ncbi:MAG: tRNA (adenosine(37)-N6)-dimethylallyltransferase MiaA [Aquabacterium sp.]
MPGSNAAADAQPAALVIAGPTASGKSALAMAVAQRLPCEIISMDSALVYRGMDIGTAKPTSADRAQVPHHLIDILDPSQAYSAARFVADATALVADIRLRGRHPLLVGGTMMYLHALQRGLDVMPAADADIRAALDADAATRGWPALHADLARLDPPTAARLAPNDAQRIQRALEVLQVSGQPMSAWHTGAGARQGPVWPLLTLEPQSRAWLHARIARRFDAMLDAGLVDEVRALQARGDLQAGLPSMRCVGYRQAWEALDQGALPQLRERGIAATRQLAKRQLTWLRGMARTTIACDGPDAQALALDRAIELLN